MDDRFSPGNADRPPLRLGRALRWSSRASFGGWPLVSIAVGPDPEKGEIRGHARGVIAIGDAAAGYFAIGGAAFGKYVISAGRVDPEVMDFVRSWAPWIERHLPGVR